MTTIQLKAVKTNEYLSKDSTAFGATLYIDGKRTAIATDDGWGGCICYETHGMPKGAKERYDAAEAAAKEATGWTFEALSGFIGHLLTRADGRMRRWAGKCAKKGLTHITEGHGHQWTATRGPAGPDSLPINYFTSAPSVEITREKAVELDLILEDATNGAPGPRKR